MADKLIHIRTARLGKPLEKNEFDARLNALPATIQTELRGYKRWQDAQASLAGKLLLQQLLAELQLPFGLHDLQTGHKDRPHIDPGFDFNISHSGEWVAVALALNNRVGIDIEKQRALDPFLFRKYFTETEWAQLDPTDPLPAFFRLWTIKEAAIKCDGRGVEVLGKTTVLDDHTVQCDAHELYYETIHVAEGYPGAWCAAQQPAGINRQFVVLFPE